MSVEYDRCELTKELSRVFISPASANKALGVVRPVVSLKAEKMSTKWKGTFYSAACLSSTNDPFVVAIGISESEENNVSWQWFLEQLQESCPILYSDLVKSSLSEYKKHVFIGNLRNGLKEALFTVFPNNHSIYCALSLENLVEEKYGRHISIKILEIASTFSCRREETLMSEIQRINEDAAEFINGIDPKTWKSTEWTQEDIILPNRYGVIACFIPHVDEYLGNHRGKRITWMDYLEGVMESCCNRISYSRVKYKGFLPSKVIPSMETRMTQYWSIADDLDVLEINDNDVVEYKTLEPDHKGGKRLKMTQILKPRRAWCSCSLWQENSYPCVHACAYFKEIEGLNFDDILRGHISEYYKYGSLQILYEDNIKTVMVDNIKSDWETKPPYQST